MAGVRAVHRRQRGTAGKAGQIGERDCRAALGVGVRRAEGEHGGKKDQHGLGRSAAGKTSTEAAAREQSCAREAMAPSGS